MLTFKPIDFNRDIDQVVSLIQQNLDSEVTNSFFLEKHLKNPFGKSFGVVARKNEEIVGVRMGLFWEFVNYYSDQKIRSIRPVDTVVSRKYRKQGIFTKMNQDFMEIVKNKDYDLIFNTPNKNSFPANIQMGWKVLENRNHYKIGIINLFGPVAEFSEILPGQIFYKADILNDPHYNTNYRDNFFGWRYGSGKYKVVSFNKDNSNCIVYTVIWIKGVKTIIIYDILGDKTYYPTMVNSLGKANNCYFIYYLNNANWEKNKFLFTLTRKKPNILFRNDRKSIRENIKFSVGDLEAII